MKRILDRFDNSPLWIRFVTVSSFILVAGLYTVKKEYGCPSNDRDPTR